MSGTSDGGGGIVRRTPKIGGHRERPITGRQRSGGRSLLESSAHLFDDAPAGAPAPGSAPAPGVQAMIDQLTTLSERKLSRNEPSAKAELPTHGPDLERLINTVVDRIEQRVIDELERRGRRDGRSGF